MARIKMVKAREVLDSRGNPTVEAEIETSDGLFRAIVPSGASTGIHEAVELRDSGKRFDGKGVLRAVSNVNNMIAKKIIGMNVESQKDIDEFMILLDSTENKQRLGANAILAVSMAACRAGAASKNIPLYRHIQQLSRTQNIVMPVPSMNIINGGAHAGNNLDIQEFMIMPTGARNFSHAIQIGVEVYHHLKKFILAEHGKNAINVGDEGGFAPPLRKISQAFHLIEQTLDELGYEKEVQLGVDCAASQYYRKFEYVVEGKRLSRQELMKFYEKLIDDHGLISIEDPFQQDDFDSFAEFTAKVGQKVQVVGDDLTVSNVQRLKIAIEKKAINCLLLKVNQVGTVTEALDAAIMAKKNELNVMVSHRSGDTDDSFIADLSVGLGCGQLKSGAPARGERTAKYNQLLRIEDELGSKARYQGRIR